MHLLFKYILFPYINRLLFKSRHEIDNKNYLFDFRHKTELLFFLY